MQTQGRSAVIKTHSLASAKRKAAPCFSPWLPCASAARNKHTHTYKCCVLHTDTQTLSKPKPVDCGRSVHQPPRMLSYEVHAMTTRRLSVKSFRPTDFWQVRTLIVRTRPIPSKVLPTVAPSRAKTISALLRHFEGAHPLRSKN